MSNPAPFGPVADLFSRSLSIRHVYGEPVQRGETTVIPVAKVVYAFGAGGGQGPGRARGRPLDESPAGEHGHAEAQGGGGGGAARMTPVGVLEIGPEGTRFIRFHPVAPWVGAAALGLMAGWLLVRRRG